MNTPCCPSCHLADHIWCRIKHAQVASVACSSSSTGKEVFAPPPDCQGKCTMTFTDVMRCLQASRALRGLAPAGAPNGMGMAMMEDDDEDDDDEDDEEDDEGAPTSHMQ